jgi:hypothetical protein
MTMPKFAAETADPSLARLDKTARLIQANYEAWGMPFEAAKEIVNVLDRTADEIEVASFGEGSFRTRQLEVIKQARTAEVIERDADEKYMSTFENPMAPIQVEGDEPYMKAYRDDQSSAVNHGESTTGRPLAP